MVFFGASDARPVTRREQEGAEHYPGRTTGDKEPVDCDDPALESHDQL